MQQSIAKETVEDLKEKVFPTKPVHFAATNQKPAPAQAGGKQVRVL